MLSNGFLSILKKFKSDRQGATAIEYGLIAAGIAVVIIGVVYSIGGNLNTKFTEIDTKLSGGAAAPQ